MTNKVDFGDIITAMVTPFNKNGEVDFDTVKSLSNYLLKNGTDTLLLTGSTGEEAQLEPDEKKAIVKCVRDFTPPNTRIMVAVGDNNTRRAIDKAQHAFSLGANAVLITVPSYIKPSQQAMFIYFSSIAKAIGDRPMMIYNIPGRTGKEILPKTVAKLAEVNPNIVGIKQSMPNMDRITELKKLCPADFQIYSGDDNLTLPMLSLGARGVVSVISHLEGKMIKEMIQNLKAGHVDQALNRHLALSPLFSFVSMHDASINDDFANPLPIKEALYQRGLIATPAARTLGELSRGCKNDMKSTLMQFDRVKADFSGNFVANLNTQIR